MITKELKELVKQEADNLIIHATLEERNRLDFETMIAKHSDNCIYGQMTGHCFNERALELLEKCTVPFSVFATEFIEPSNDNFIRSLSRDFSPIEFFICQKNGGKNKNLINYLKGNSTTLKL